MNRLSQGGLGGFSSAGLECLRGGWHTRRTPMMLASFVYVCNIQIEYCAVLGMLFH